MNPTASKSNNVNLFTDASTAKNNNKATPTRATRQKKNWGFLTNPVQKLDKFLGKNPHLIFYIAAFAIIFLFAWYYGIAKELAVSNAKIEFIQKKFDDSETAYREDVKNEIRIARCNNGVILECYNKCNLQEIIKRQNACEAIK
jgi:hypothetical protein